MISASFMHQCLGPINKLLLCNFAGVASVPIYEIAFGCAQQLKSLAEAGLRALMPEVSRIGSNSVEAVYRIRQLNERASRLILLFCSPCYLAAFMATKPLLGLWIGEPLATELAPVLGVFLVGSYVNLISVPSYYTLMGLGKIGTIFRASVVFLGTNLIAVAIILLAFRTLSPTLVAYCVSLALIATSSYLILKKKELICLLTLRTSASTMPHRDSATCLAKGS